MKWFFPILMIIFFSCSKKNTCSTSNPDGSFTKATVLYAGMPAADGCDWVIQIGSQHYHPETLSPEFMKNNLKVKICYEHTSGHFSCGLRSSAMSVIRVLEIKKS